MTVVPADDKAEAVSYAAQMFVIGPDLVVRRATRPDCNWFFKAGGFVENGFLEDGSLLRMEV